jgi:hypothetical protein
MTDKMKAEIIEAIELSEMVHTKSGLCICPTVEVNTNSTLEGSRAVGHIFCYADKDSTEVASSIAYMEIPNFKTALRAILMVLEARP